MCCVLDMDYIGYHQLHTVHITIEMRYTYLEWDGGVGYMPYLLLLFTASTTCKSRGTVKNKCTCTDFNQPKLSNLGGKSGQTLTSPASKMGKSSSNLRGNMHRIAKVGATSHRSLSVTGENVDEIFDGAEGNALAQN